MKNNFSNRNTNGRRAFRPRSVVRWFCGLALLLAGCAENLALEPQDGAAGNDNEQVTVCLDLVPDILSSVEVKAAGAIDENIIRDAWVFQFTPDGSAQLQAPLYTETVFAAADGSYRIGVKLVSQDSKIYIVANTHDSTWGAGFAKQSALEAARLDISSHSDFENGIPMTGIWTGTPSASVGIFGRISLTRVVSKITFNLSLDDEMLPGVFRVTDIQLMARPNRIKFFGSDVLDDRFLADDYRETGEFDAPLTRVYYMPEYLAGTSEGLSPLDKNESFLPPTTPHPSCIDVKGIYLDDIIAMSCELSFRIYLGENNINDYNVRRNTHYTVDVTIRSLDKADVRISFMNDNRDDVIYDFAQSSYPEICMLTYVRGDVGYDTAANFCPPGWRLPTLSEALLFSFFREDLFSSQGVYYWTSTPSKDDPALIYAIEPWTADIVAREKVSDAAVRCVRSGRLKS